MSTPKLNVTQREQKDSDAYVLRLKGKADREISGAVELALGTAFIDGSRFERRRSSPLTDLLVKIGNDEGIEEDEVAQVLENYWT